MLKRIQYTTQEERELQLNQNAQLILVEEQNLIDGNFLIFSDEPIPEPVYTGGVNIVLPQVEFNALKATVDQLVLDALEV